MYAQYKKMVEDVTSVLNSPTFTGWDHPDRVWRDSRAEDEGEIEKFHREFPQLQESFDIIDKFVTEIKDDPSLESPKHINVMRSVLIGASETDIKNLGDYFALVEAAHYIKVSYDTHLRSLGTTCLASVSDDMTQSNYTRVQNMELLREIVSEQAARSPSFVEKVCQSGMLESIVEDLKVTTVEDVAVEDSAPTILPGVLYQKSFFILDSSATLILNCSVHPAARVELRKYETVTHLLPLLKCQSKDLQLVTLIILGNIADETENEHLLADDTIFDVLFEIFDLAWAMEQHRAPSGWSVRGVMVGMAGLAKNDSNKTVLYEKGVVPVLMKVLKGGFEPEVEYAAKCTWELAFDKTIRKEFIENEELLSMLNNLKSSPVKSISKAAEGALWVIHQDDRIHTPHAASAGGNDVSIGHVMISYQWADQKMLLKLKDSLFENGFKVWMDVVNMSESTLEAMAKAVEDAAVVLVCMSERYKLSQNCRSEAEYAFALKKKIVPLIMQEKYTPDGWLGIIKGTKLFFDFSGKYQYNDVLGRLLRELGRSGKLQQRGSGTEKHLPSLSKTQRESVQENRVPSMSNWSQKDVQNWLTKIGLQDKPSLKNLSVANLMFLRHLSKTAPEYYYKYLETKLGLESLDDLTALWIAIEEL